MKSNPWRAALFLLLIAGMEGAPADETVPTDIPPPKFPWVAAPSDHASWTITIGAGAANADSNPAFRVREIQSAKVGDFKRDIETLNDGTTREIWYAKGLTLLPNNGDVTLIDPQRNAAPMFGGPRGDPLIDPGFPGFTWVEKKNYDQVALFQKIACYHYVLHSEDPAVVNPDGTKDASKDVLEAWVDAKTGLPVAYSVSGVLFVYKFGDPVTAIVMPPAYQKAFDDYEKVLARRAALERDLAPPAH